MRVFYSHCGALGGCSLAWSFPTNFKLTNRNAVALERQHGFSHSNTAFSSYQCGVAIMVTTRSFAHSYQSTWNGCIVKFIFYSFSEVTDSFIFIFYEYNQKLPICVINCRWCPSSFIWSRPSVVCGSTSPRTCALWIADRVLGSPYRSVHCTCYPPMPFDTSRVRNCARDCS